MSDPLLEVLDWLATNLHERPATAVFAELCQRVRGLGVPIDRAAIQLDNLHPLYFGYCLHWQVGEPAVEVPRSHAFERSPEFLASPYMAARRNGGRFRWRSADEAEPTLPLIRELQARGFTDYLGVLVANGATWPPGLGWATRHPNGFTAAHAAVLERLSRQLAAPFALFAERRKLDAVLRTYLGDGPAAAVARGQVERGELVAIEAVVLLTDLRGFSALAASSAEQVVIDRLAGYAEAVAAAVTEAGGDVLKFIGDGILSLFAIEDSEAEAAGSALRAVRTARSRFSPPFTATLDVGRVAYGNVGARERLDFTVIGQAVNVASRLEALAKELGVATLATARFAALAPDPGRSVGAHRLRGLAEPVPVITYD